MKLFSVAGFVVVCFLAFASSALAQRTLADVQREEEFKSHIIEAQKSLERSESEISQEISILTSILENFERYSPSERKETLDNVEKQVTILEDLFPSFEAEEIHKSIKTVRNSLEKVQAETVESLAQHVRNLKHSEERRLKQFRNSLHAMTELLWVEFNDQNFSEIKSMINSPYVSMMEKRSEAAFETEKALADFHRLVSLNQQIERQVKAARDSATENWKENGCKNCRDLVRNLESVLDREDQAATQLETAIESMGDVRQIQKSHAQSSKDIASQLLQAWNIVIG